MKNFEKNIKEYANSIQSMDSFRDAVRHNPGMHIGGTGNVGFINMVREIYSNAVDELVKPTSPCNWVKLTFDERDYRIIVEDNGRGIPFNLMIDIFQKEYTSSNYTKMDYEYSSGVHGIGSKITCALSDLFTVKSHIFGECKYVEFHDGFLWDKGDIVDIDKSNMDREQGTTITFVPYEKLRNMLTVTCEDVRNLVYTILLLTPINSTIEFIGIDKSGHIKYQDCFVNKNGLIDELRKINQTPLINDIVMQMDTGKIKIDAVINMTDEVATIASFCNLTPTLGGVHADGFYNGIIKFFRNYMNKVYLGDNSKIQVKSEDIKYVICGVIHTLLLKPNFIGQSKDLLGDDIEGKIKIATFISDFIESSLIEWSKSNPKDLNKISKMLKAVAEARMKSEGTIKKLSNNYKKSSINNLPEDYKKPSGKQNLELFIVEGKSALSSAINARNPMTQGFYPIRGKLPNAFEKKPEQMLTNSEVSAIIEIIGGGYGKNFNLNNVKFDKIIFLTDPDPDGSHIATLLLNLFAVYMPELIEDGRVYKAVPPLYGMNIGKDKMRYFVDKAEQIKYVQSLFIKENTICIDGHKLSNDKLFDLLYKNSEYVFELEKLSNNYAVPPILMEAILVGHINGTPIKKTYKYLKDKYFRFLNHINENGTDIINGLANDMAIELIIVDNLYRDSKRVFDILLNNIDFNFSLNNNNVSLYELMKSYKSYEPSSLQRYKGLGEMEAFQLKDSTLSIDNRTLIQYTPENIKTEINQMRLLSSNRHKLLEGVEFIKRSDLI